MFCRSSQAKVLHNIKVGFCRAKRDSSLQMEEILLESKKKKKLSARKFYASNTRKKNQFGLPRKDWIFWRSWTHHLPHVLWCKKITTINSAGNGNVICLYHHLSGSQASTTTETYLAISHGASLDILFKYMLYKPNRTKCLNSGISRCCFSG